MIPLKVLASAGLILAGSQAFGGDDLPTDVEHDVAAVPKSELFHRPTRLKAADGVISSGQVWGHSSPWVEDVDGDGVRDLIVGDFSGFFKFFKNEGTNQTPRYAAGLNLKAGDVDAKVWIY